MKVDYGLDAPGRAVGVDLWSATDQSGNRREATLANAEAGLAGVARSGRSFRMYPPVRVDTARGPAA
jgi:hypothetical protein